MNLAALTIIMGAAVAALAISPWALIPLAAGIVWLAAKS